ncbi:hypothetical protein VNO77_25965 [Canavalia gladiata]|uniref:Uncharacterized protein n=1 Tax=Canavalia gladiata TaxID=3824 RepID=A0AAN9Q588_CANGL
MAGGGSLGESEEMRGEQIERAFSFAWMVHQEPERDYLLETNNGSEIFISFPGSGTVQDWYSQTTFGETKIDLGLFPSLKSIGNTEPASVNQAFQNRFQRILLSLEAEVDKAINEQKQIVFTGHSSGAPMAILATLWALEKYITSKSHDGISLLCITFGSPLVGNHIFSHAIRRENWSRYFLHIVMRHDIVPQILLAPLSSLDQGFETISQFFNPRSESFMSQLIGGDTQVSEFYSAVVSKAATVTSYAACKLMGSKYGIEEPVADFIPLSPYRPFGTYIFCTGNGTEEKQIVVRNSGAVLQLMFFFSQLSTELEIAQASYRSLREHIIHGTELQQTLRMQNVVYLDQLRDFPSSEDGAGGSTSTTNSVLNDLDQLSGRAILCLRAAEELEVQKLNYEDRLQLKKDLVEENMRKLETYREMMQEREVGGYYYAFKVHSGTEDFKANIMRIQLGGVWDDIIEKLRSYELPDEFEGKEEWIELGTRFRRLVEPLDIANYYRFSRHHVISSYKDRGRPRRYRYTQRWLEHAQRRPEESNPESCFWADVEDLCDMI